tara:strand:+ start:724 stop:912 length:189 start_codon:yes stop_codon:yes gene_type:complete
MGEYKYKPIYTLSEVYSLFGFKKDFCRKLILQGKLEKRKYGSKKVWITGESLKRFVEGLPDG